jgi:translation initiation factor 2 beta subunit (eIF-2beta)/eIF-5
MEWIGIEIGIGNGDEEDQKRERGRLYLCKCDGCFALHCVVLLLFVLLAGASC